LDVTVGKLIFFVDTESRIAFYFLCTAESTEVSLGGLEKNRMSAQEQYQVEWLELEKLKDVTFIPAPAKDAIFKYLENPDQPAFFFTTNQ